MNGAADAFARRNVDVSERPEWATTIRCERDDQIHQALLTLGCARICRNDLQHG
jgi:hypothetical protein